MSPLYFLMLKIALQGAMDLIPQVVSSMPFDVNSRVISSGLLLEARRLRYCITVREYGMARQRLRATYTEAENE